MAIQKYTCNNCDCQCCFWSERRYYQCPECGYLINVVISDKTEKANMEK